MIYCPICKNESILIWQEKKYRVYRCKNCTLSFLYPIPESSLKIYNETYFNNWYIKYYDERKKHFEKLWGKIEKFIPDKGTLLDIGCGIGIFLDIAREKKWNVYGQDISSFSIDYCRNKGYIIYDKPLPELNLPENSIYVITMFDVLAHLQNPMEYIEKAKRLLKPAGVLIIKTPFHSRFIFSLTKLLAFTGKSKTLLHVPAQIYHFTPQSFKNIIRSEELSLLYLEKTQDFLKIGFKNPKILLSNIPKLIKIEQSLLVIIKKQKK
jgi:2-polyprenyl-3-methyl-5-hydroxy-6-metoxy-1,4-benzoquinol methylase